MFLLCRLALRDLRYRLAQALLLLLAITAGAATLTLGLALHGTTNHPYERTRAATNGPDVVATLSPGGGIRTGAQTATSTPAAAAASSLPPDADVLLPLETAAGVAAYSGPFPVTWLLLHDGRTSGGAEVEGRNAAPGSVDRPKSLRGGWVRPGGVVVEAGFASALNIHLGDALTLGDRTFHVVGTAVTAAIPAYPNTCAQAEGCILGNAVAHTSPGLVWTTESDATELAGSVGPAAYYLNLKLTDPTGAQRFADDHNESNSANAPYLLTWQQIRAGDAQTLAKAHTALVTGSWFLALLAIASVAVLVGGRMVEQTRRFGLLKAVGATPGFVATVLLVEHLMVGLCAAGAGLALGRLAAPLIDRTGAGLLGAAGAPAVTGTTVASVIALALAVGIVSTGPPALRAARQSTVAALNDAARRPRRRDAVMKVSARMPVTLLLGVRLVARRPWRLLLSAFSVSVTTSGLVLVRVLTNHATTAGGALASPLAHATTVIAVLLAGLAAVNAVIIAWTTALESQRSAALAQALGAAPGQVAAGLTAAQLLPISLGGLLGIPVGIGVYAAAKTGPGHLELGSPLWLGALVVLTLLASAGLTAIATGFGVRRPIAETLRAERV